MATNDNIYQFLYYLDGNLVETFIFARLLIN
ncbi:hypothetical protein FHW89_003889 [Mucilaginibacter sp. SG564]|nr:hypothetical protein [Mucilaginibacter sp. SG564]